MHLRTVVGLGCFVAAAGASVTAFAEDPTIRSTYQHPSYVFDAEPHFLFGYAGPFDADHSAAAGFRGTFNILDHGFVQSINDSVGLGVGVDFAGGRHLIVPVVLQWNFWLSPHWSVFGEPGVAWESGGPNDVLPIVMGGGRFNFNDSLALTLRAGYPGLSVGLSILL
ncbi:MAG: hypothetical protein M3O36_05740 [Myxococcota bacterium]|nr:hypothetical protein [Myxococcota bacterium]